MMNGKIFVNVLNVQARIEIITEIAKLNYDFIETNMASDLRFKYDLFKDKISIFVHELSDRNYHQEFRLIEDMVARGIKIIILLEKYSAKAIDDAMQAGASDVIVLPLNEGVFHNKLNAIIGLSKKIEKSTTITKEEDKVLISPTVINGEIARANRGAYNISLVLFEIGQSSPEELDWFIDQLQYRETDVVLRYSKNKGLAICPFTGKENIAEVENKVRNLYIRQKNEFKLETDLSVYGITYPKDGENANELMRKLEEGIHDFKVFSNIKGTLKDINRDEFEKVYRLLKRNTSQTN